MSQNVLPPPPSNHGLTSMFAGAESEHSSHWQRLWDKGDFLPFDRGFPNPALEDVLISRTNVIGTPLQNTDGSRRVRRKTALVPGCGRGYDVLLLASFGYDAYGLEISETAVQRCREEQKRNGHKYPVRNQEVGLGKAQFLLGDWFDHFAWKNDAGDIEDIRGFDLIYDYTVGTALGIM
ncbi:hypothetical protein MMC19_006180 [Ptychographa xylographoides]|nr:hypothetical protein [Ptychographa xylographoides]